MQYFSATKERSDLATISLISYEKQRDSITQTRYFQETTTRAL